MTVFVARLACQTPASSTQAGGYSHHAHWPMRALNRMDSTSRLHEAALAADDPRSPQKWTRGWDALLRRQLWTLRMRRRGHRTTAVNL